MSYNYLPIPPRQYSGKAIASLVLGILGLLLPYFIPPIAALLLARMANADLQSNPDLEGHGIATTGKVLGWIGLVFSVLMCCYILFVFVYFSSWAGGS